MITEKLLVTSFNYCVKLDLTFPYVPYNIKIIRGNNYTS